VEDRLLGVVGGLLEVHRLTCAACGAVSHYDRKRGGGRVAARSAEHFVWIPEPGAPPPSAR